MWESILLTVAATAGNNIGKILQKKGTIILPPLSFKLKVIRSYASNRTWVIGFLVDIFGALLMLRALSLAPVSVIQPVSGCGLAILSLFSHFYLKEVMNAVDWVGITLAGFGTIGKELVLEVRSMRYCLMDGFEYARVNEENKKWMSSVISKIGFIFLDQGFPKLLAPVCILISVCCSGTGFYYQTRGLKHGRAIVVSTCAAVASILTGVLAGMFALGERLPSEPKARLALLLGWLLIIMGVILLVGSTRLVRFLSCSSSQRRSNVDKNFGLRRTTSSRVREPSPSAIIQAATLNHLLSSSSKEKA
ncbi:probable magnesium transporter NIPA9 isoform X6 [Vigna radiata var. radiata]|uniref:Probable magnesium transporter n=1 Tax=Vigna radiata var. radiata TaxID=3916 RepID=A0A3Q0F3Z3_VIGRR|nr:probable magnesium transporter NIPA9 isoform X6 [Vigna radiata var. radiata]